MKTTINALRAEISTKTKANDKLFRQIISNAVVEKVEESTGMVKVLKDVEDVTTLLTQYKAGMDEVCTLKSKVAALNNSITLSNGMTIQEALVRLATLRTSRSLLERLSGVQKKTTRRADGGLNGTAYYEIVEPNFDMDAVKHDIDEHTAEIDRIELEIANLNAKEIEV